MSDQKVVCPECQKSGKARAGAIDSAGREGWICEEGHEFVWTYQGTPPGTPRMPPLVFEIQLGSASYQCDVNDFGAVTVTELSRQSIAVGECALGKKPGGTWYVQSRPPQITEPMAFQIEAFMNGWSERT